MKRQCREAAGACARMARAGRKRLLDAGALVLRRHVDQLRPREVELPGRQISSRVEPHAERPQSNCRTLGVIRIARHGQFLPASADPIDVDLRGFVSETGGDGVVSAVASADGHRTAG